jgi:hypothetical protein
MDEQPRGGLPETVDDGYYNPVFEKLMSAAHSPAVGAIAYALGKTAMGSGSHESK